MEIHGRRDRVLSILEQPLLEIGKALPFSSLTPPSSAILCRTYLSGDHSTQLLSTPLPSPQPLQSCLIITCHRSHFHVSIYLRLHPCHLSSDHKLVESTVGGFWLPASRLLNLIENLTMQCMSGTLRGRCLMGCVKNKYLESTSKVRTLQGNHVFLKASRKRHNASSSTMMCSIS